MKNIKYHHLILLVVLVLFLLGAFFYFQKRQLTQESGMLQSDKELFEKKTLRLLMPYSTFSRNQKSSELNRLIKFIKEEKGFNLVLGFENNRSIALNKLKQGEVDCLADNFILTSQIDTNSFLPVNEQYCEPIYLVQRADSLKIERQIDLSNKCITLPKDSELQIFVKHLSREIGDSVSLSLDPNYGTEQLILKVLSGTIDYTLCSSEEARYYAKEFPQLDTSLPVSFSLRRAWLLRKNSTMLRDSLDLWLNQIPKQ